MFTKNAISVHKICDFGGRGIIRDVLGKSRLPPE